MRDAQDPCRLGADEESWALLRRHPALLRFPLYGALAALVPLIVQALPGVDLIDSKASTVGGIVLALVGVYGAIFGGYDFSVGLAAAADATFHGREPTRRDGLRRLAGPAAAARGSPSSHEHEP